MATVWTRSRLRQRRWLMLLLLIAAGWFYVARNGGAASDYIPSFPSRRRGSLNWSKLRRNYPVGSFIRLPPGHPEELPAIQTAFGSETAEEKTQRLQRQAAVKKSFQFAWAGYKEHAWGEDEVIPIGGGARTSFGGWGATLVDSLDTLWIMDLKDEFREAVMEVAKTDFTVAAMATLSTFETTIRFLGGLLSAYDLSSERVLLQQAVELGEMLYKAFDTPNHMPISTWEWRENVVLKANQKAPIAEIGSLSMEFTRLSQLTREPKYFDAIQRITDLLQKQQNETSLPGMFPSWAEPADAIFNNGRQFTMNGLVDSLYEYLPKEHLLLGGGAPAYMQMYDAFFQTAKKHAFFRAMNRKGKRIQFSGTTYVYENGPEIEPKVQHLGCFAGGMVALASRLRDGDRDAELQLAYELMNGCVWGYESSPSGIMPEQFRAVPCDDSECRWDQSRWQAEVLEHGPTIVQAVDDKTPVRVEVVIEKARLPEGISSIHDRRYLLRPEAIESVFVLYRITGDRNLLDTGWTMFEAIDNHTRTEIAHSSLDDVTLPHPKKLNKMESFWTGETLKYFYLLFSDPDVISLDEYVFNTEAHPFRYRKRASG